MFKTPFPTRNNSICIIISVADLGKKMLFI